MSAITRHAISVSSRDAALTVFAGLRRFHAHEPSERAARSATTPEAIRRRRAVIA